MHDEALWSVAGETDLFAEVDPNQKERIILALKKMGHAEIASILREHGARRSR